jgi:hypothetical protein
MKLFGKDIRSDGDLNRAMNGRTLEEQKAAHILMNDYLKQKAKKMIDNESNTERKRQMEVLYNQRIYDFSPITGIRNTIFD